ERAQNVKQRDDDRNVSFVAINHHPHEAEMPGHDECEHADASENQPTKQRQVVGREFGVQNARRHPENFIVSNHAPDCGRWSKQDEIVNPPAAVVSIPFVMPPGLPCLSLCTCMTCPPRPLLAACHPGLFRSPDPTANLA